MNLLFLVSNRHFGGGKYSIIKFAEALSKRGHKVTITCVKYPHYIKTGNNLQIKVRKTIPFLFKGCGWLDRKWADIHSEIIKRKSNFDIFFGLQIEDAKRAVKLGKKYKIPVANFVFETPEWIKRVWRDLKFDRRFEREWSRFETALHKSDVIIAISNSTKRYVEKWLSRKVECVAFPGIDREIADSVPEQNKEKQIIFIGALEERKNIGDVIFALSKIKNRPRFVICGEGELLPSLGKLCKKLNVNCVFKGKVDEYTKWKEIKKSLFMVFPSSFEGFGMPPAEALYSKIPCIASDLEILRENYGDTLEYFPVHNISVLGEKIRFLLENPEYIDQRGKKGYNYIKEKFFWKKSAEEIEKCIYSMEHIRPKIAGRSITKRNYV